MASEMVRTTILLYCNVHVLLYAMILDNVMLINCS